MVNTDPHRWATTPNVKKCATVVCNQDKANPGTFKRSRREYEIPIVDQYAYRGGKISEDCSWDAHIADAIGKGKSRAGKMDVILTDSHLDTITGGHS